MGKKVYRNYQTCIVQMHYTAPIRKAQGHLQRRIAKQQNLCILHNKTVRRDAVTVAHMVMAMFAAKEVHIYARSWDAQPMTKHVVNAAKLAIIQQCVG